MKLSRLVSEYIDLKQSMGMRFNSDAVILRAFCKAVNTGNIKTVSPEAVNAYLTRSGSVTSFWHRKYTALDGFYRFAMGRGYVSCSPLPPFPICKPLKSFVAYIYTPDEFHRLLEATAYLNNTRYQIDSHTFRTLLFLLFNTGVRIGEAMALNVSDINFDTNLLTIRTSKFFKSRLVPFDPRLGKVLQEYAQNVHTADSPETPYFLMRNGSRLTHGCTERGFRYLCESCGIKREDTVRYQPRLHDIRHSFAANRLLVWYRQKADVQRLLAYLSTEPAHKLHH
jgi:integrase